MSDVLMRVKRKFCLDGFRNRITFDGRLNIPVAIAHIMANVSTG